MFEMQEDDLSAFLKYKRRIFL